MHRCNEEQADIFIDGAYHRFDDLAELKTLSRLKGTKGVEFMNYWNTYQRLKHQRMVRLTQRRAEKRATVAQKVSAKRL